MTATIDTAAAGSGASAGSDQAPATLADADVEKLTPRAMIPVYQLTEHPGNVRRDIDLDAEFLTSIAELGVLTPLRITPGSGAYRVIEGHRRLAAAIKLGITEVPYDLAVEREQDEAGQFLDMYATNHHRKGLTALEEADALFAASQAGASRTRIRKATGLGRDQVSAALTAAAVSGTTRAAAEAFGDAVTLDQLALLAEFNDDEESVARLMNAFCDGRSGEHEAERIRQERVEAAEHEQLVAQFTADGYAITQDLPPGAVMLYSLQHDGQDLTPEAHRQCPGRGIFFAPYQPLRPRHFCTHPATNGHASRYQGSPLPNLTGDSGGDGDNRTASSGTPDPQRKLVIEGNRAWVAARNVRKRWLADVLLARRTAPRETLPFVTAQLLAMPQALGDALTRAPRSGLFTEVTGGSINSESVGGWAAGRLPIALLAVIASAYEDRMDGDAGRATWRTDQRFSQCNRKDAGTYLRFLRDVGYELSPVEQAVADGVPYTGDQPDSALDAIGDPDGANGETAPAETGGEQEDADDGKPAEG